MQEFAGSRQYHDEKLLENLRDLNIPFDVIYIGKATIIYLMTKDENSYKRVVNIVRNQKLHNTYVYYDTGLTANKIYDKFNCVFTKGSINYVVCNCDSDYYYFIKALLYMSKGVKAEKYSVIVISQ